ncbi:MAG: adenylate/guanylate cyclase domain-containing protein [Bacteroidota bacterium]
MQIKDAERCIDLEIVKTEKRRLEIFIGVILFGLVLQLSNYLFFSVSISELFNDPRSANAGILISLGFVVVLMGSRFIVGKISGCEKPLPMSYKFYSIFLESIVPIIWLHFVIELEKNAIFLDSPVLFIYLPILIVSALHLNFWLSFFNGAFVGLLMAAITFWAFQNYPETLPLPSIAYYTKASLLFLAGICGGLVSRELKKRLTVSIEAQEEKDKIEAMFSRQVSPQVVNALKSESDYSINAHVSLLFLDIRGFTQRVQHMSPMEVNDFQNKFFGPMIDCVGHHAGIINQLMGDGLMATFASADGEHHEERAFRAALDIFESLDRSNEGLEEPIKIGIGIHSGEVIAGNIGTKERHQFSISGIPVITAARLEQMTKDYDCSLLVSNEFYQKIKHLAPKCVSLGEVRMKGLDKPLEIIKIH